MTDDFVTPKPRTAEPVRNPHEDETPPPPWTSEDQQRQDAADEVPTP